MAAYTVPSAADLARVGGAFGLAEARITPVSRGTVNSSFRLDTASGPRFLRIYEEQDLAGALREVALLGFLAEHGARTPMPLASLDGERVLEIAGKPAVLFPFISGDMCCQAAVTPRIAERLGAEVARLHAAALGAPDHGSRFDESELARRIREIEGSPLGRLAPSLGERLARIAAVRARDLPGGMIHGDIFRDNVLWDGDEPTAILDFESAGLGSFAYDLAVVVLAWTFGDRFLPDLAGAVARGYASVRPLEGAEKHALFDELRFGALRFTITRITDCALRGDDRKDYRRFEARLAELEGMGRRGLASMLGW